MSPTLSRPRIGLALGSGSARGWSHVGVLRVLERAGIVPDIVCGSSIGALVGAVYAAGQLDRFEPWIRSLTWQSVVGLMDLKMDGGLIQGSKLIEFFRSRFDDPGIAGLGKAYGCVATELPSGREIWLREGSVVDAVRASLALPGLFTPAQRDGRLLVDGGLVNPVPVSLCRAMGADLVIAVDLNHSLLSRHARPAAPLPAEAPARPGLLDALRAQFWPADSAEAGASTLALPSTLEVLANSLNIMQVRITNSRLAGEPADVVLRPRLGDIGVMDFHRAALSIDEGARTAERALTQIQELIG